ncbi:WSC domain-containing protein [Anaeromyxobacter soli]|uniref:WSC domain-containing protein n=1 Tax=Anaeromyxobacter soli TaxID=2922725 RepID=UPI001FAF2EBB|nr:WSC domain-containing protein [Anaeromyxobacter sp. SG29]
MPRTARVAVTLGLVLARVEPTVADVGEYQGCYTDTEPRALPTLLMSSGATVENCTAAAAAQGFAYAGLQYYGYCFAGNELRYTKVVDSECNTSCTANPAQACGGAWRNSIYAAGRADLFVTALTGIPDAIGVGDSLTIRDTVTASVDGATAGEFEVGFYLSTTSTGGPADVFLNAARTVAGGLAPGQSSSGETSLSIPIDVLPGIYYLIAVADLGEVVSEFDETNNSFAAGPFVVGPYSCQPPAPIDDGNPCTLDQCDPMTGVIHPPVSAGTICIDGCRTEGTCDGAGACTGVPRTGAACDDGDPCTYSDVCSENGICVGTAVSCRSAGPCQQVHCDGTPVCSSITLPPGTPCSSGGVCGGQICDGVSPKCQPLE